MTIVAVVLAIHVLCFHLCVGSQSDDLTSDPSTSKQSDSTDSHCVKPPYLQHPLKISAFNLKTFGRAKMSDPAKADIISRIVQLYDIILIQEIRDNTKAAINQLWDMVGRQTYGMTLSERLGRTSSKEEYAYFYRTDRVTLVDTHQYDDGPDDYTDKFEREPYCARFRPNAATWDFACVGIHVKPDHAVAEIRDLIDVYEDVKLKWSDVEDFLIMGDLNAGCSYASESELLGLPIYNQTLFSWPLSFDADTTTSTNTECPYDRFILNGPNLQSHLIPESVGIYRFEVEHGLSYDQMTGISDHYPIELELRSKKHRKLPLCENCRNVTSVKIPRGMPLYTFETYWTSQLTNQMYFGWNRPATNARNIEVMIQKTSNSTFERSAQGFLALPVNARCVGFTNEMVLTNNKTAEFNVTSSFFGGTSLFVFFSSCPTKYMWYLQCIDWIEGQKMCPIENTVMSLSVRTSSPRSFTLPWDKATKDLRKVGLQFDTQNFNFALTFGENVDC